MNDKNLERNLRFRIVELRSVQARARKNASYEKRSRRQTAHGSKNSGLTLRMFRKERKSCVATCKGPLRPAKFGKLPAFNDKRKAPASRILNYGRGREDRARGEQQRGEMTRPVIFHAGMFHASRSSLGRRSPRVARGVNNSSSGFSARHVRGRAIPFQRVSSTSIRTDVA